MGHGASHNSDPSSWLPLYVEHVTQSMSCLGVSWLVIARPQRRVRRGRTGGFGLRVWASTLSSKKCRRSGAARNVRQVLAAVASLPPTVGAVMPYMSQESAVGAFQVPVPARLTSSKDFSLPIEDFINQPPSVTKACVGMAFGTHVGFAARL